MSISAGSPSSAGASGPSLRRRWTDEEKRRIVAETEAPGSSVSAVACRHDLNSNLLFRWRRQFRQGGLGAGVGPAAFVPAVIAPEKSSEAGEPGLMPGGPAGAIKREPGRRRAGLIEIVLVGGYRVIVDKKVSAAALGRIIGVLERR